MSTRKILPLRNSTPIDTTFSLRNLRYQTGSMDEVASRLADQARHGTGTRLVIPVNGQVFVLAYEQPALAAVINRAEEVVLDGISVFTASRLLGKTDAHRHQGVDLMFAICRKVDPGSHLLLLGGRPGAAELTKAVIEKECPHLVIETYCPPFGFEKSAEGLAEVEQVIRTFKPSIVFAAFGAPKQELFMDTYLRAWDVPVAMAVGGSFEMIGGMVTRAPRWIRFIGMEWFFRMVLEPRRLAKRYFYTNTVFIWVLLKELFSSKPASAR